jgi:hypothetical protein
MSPHHNKKETTMAISYTVTAGNDNNPLATCYQQSAKGEKQAARVAEAMCAEHPTLPVYVEFYRRSDSQHGYLNRNGHDLVGQDWNQ